MGELVVLTDNAVVLRGFLLSVIDVAFTEAIKSKVSQLMMNKTNGGKEASDEKRMKKKK